MFGKKRKKDVVGSGITTVASSEKNLTKNIEFISWIQEFSKKIIVATFAIFIIANIFFLVVITIQFCWTAELLYLDTYIYEINTTFRDIIGGYLIKAATENVFKIGGSFMESYMTSKTTIIEQQMVAAANKMNSTQGDEEIYYEEGDDYIPEEDEIFCEEDKEAPMKNYNASEKVEPVVKKDPIVMIGNKITYDNRRSSDFGREDQ